MFKVFLPFIDLRPVSTFPNTGWHFRLPHQLEVYDNIACDDNELGHLTPIQHITEKMWERVVRKSDDPQCRCLKITLAEMLLSFQLLETNTKNITTLSPLAENGWALKNDEISVVWDTDDNLKRVQDTIQWYTKVVRAKVVALQTGVAAIVKLTDGGEKRVVTVDRVVSVKIGQTSPMFNTNL